MLHRFNDIANICFGLLTLDITVAIILFIHGGLIQNFVFLFIFNILTKILDPVLQSQLRQWYQLSFEPTYI